MKTKKEIKERIEELQKIRNKLSQKSNHRAKYNFAIGELQWVLMNEGTLN